MSHSPSLNLNYVYSSEIMTTPPGSAGESQLQKFVAALLEDRRAIMRTVEEQTARSGATVKPTKRPAVTRGSNEVELKLHETFPECSSKDNETYRGLAVHTMDYNSG